MGGINMKSTAYIFTLFYCLAAAQHAAAQDGLIYAASENLSPLVKSVVNNFKGLLNGSTIIVLNASVGSYI
jgi:hypothetical protein